MSTNADGGSTVDWDALPEPIRLRLAEIVARAVGQLAPGDLPQQLRQVAKFAPAKRATLGFRAMLATLRDHPEFRDALRVWAEQGDLASILEEATDPVTIAAVGIILGDSGVEQHIQIVAAHWENVQLKAERDSAISKVARLEAEVAKLKAAIDEADSIAKQSGVNQDAEVDRLRKRIREQGVVVRKAKDEAEDAAAEIARIRAEADLEIKAITAERDRERQRADREQVVAERARADADLARQSAKEARDADEVRLSLLVTTIEGAITGLRRELALGDSGLRPADLVQGANTTQGIPTRARDLAELDRLLALPSVHLIVDGYNVTKTGYPELSLADQRERLSHQLAVLAARTGAEVTVVFDGAGVVVAPPATPRGVRVLFSDPGVLADDVIRSLVAAEPVGRPVMVVTSDRAVVDSIRHKGAYSSSSALLVKRLVRI